jgi:hypothetical protein
MASKASKNAALRRPLESVRWRRMAYQAGTQRQVCLAKEAGST